MQKILSLLLLLSFLSGCSFFSIHKREIEQGNIITPAMLSRVHPGMTQSQVKDIMGNPVLMNTFADNRIDYVYTFKPAQGDMVEKYITLTFSQGKLKDVTGNKYSQFIK